MKNYPLAQPRPDSQGIVFYLESADICIHDLRRDSDLHRVIGEFAKLLGAAFLSEWLPLIGNDKQGDDLMLAACLRANNWLGERFPDRTMKISWHNVFDRERNPDCNVGFLILQFHSDIQSSMNKALLGITPPDTESTNTQPQTHTFAFAGSIPSEPAVELEDDMDEPLPQRQACALGDGECESCQ